MIVSLLILILLCVLALVLRDFFPAYYSEKGKNLATREDIGRITDEMERVKAIYAEKLTAIEHQHSMLLEEIRGNQQLRMAAIDKRLQAHQEAYTRWRTLLSKLNSNDLGSVAFECQQWWDKNCLYLSPAARESFIKAFFAANMYSVLREEGDNIKERQMCVEAITAVGEAIVAGAALPPLGEEAKSLKFQTPS